MKKALIVMLLFSQLIWANVECSDDSELVKKIDKIYNKEIKNLGYESEKYFRPLGTTCRKLTIK